MTIDKEGDITIIFRKDASFSTFMENLKDAYPRLKKDNLIIDLTSFRALPVHEVLRFLELSEAHRAANRSFVLVTDQVTYDDVPEELAVTPTLQEARDLVEMEEIERDLDFE